MNKKEMGYNKIMAYRVEYNGLTFLNAPCNMPEGGALVLKEFSFFEVATNSSVDKYAIKHGEYVNPTQLKNRRIRILFDILAKDEQERWTMLKKVQRAFSPESNPSPFNPKLRKQLTFMDVDCDEWECNCQILKGIELSDFANEKRMGISVELITDSPYFFSKISHGITVKNTLPGIKLETKLPFHRKYYQGVIHGEGIIESPVMIDMKILNTSASNYPNGKIKVIQQTENDRAVMHINIDDLTLSLGDIIQVDTSKRRCYHIKENETVDITGNVSLGSNRPYILSGLNVIAIDTGVWNECIEADIKWTDLF